MIGVSGTVYVWGFDMLTGHFCKYMQILYLWKFAHTSFVNEP